jgi:hypothetical protein
MDAMPTMSPANKQKAIALAIPLISPTMACSYVLPFCLAQSVSPITLMGARITASCVA